jgi:protein ImuB
MVRAARAVRSKLQAPKASPARTSKLQAPSSQLRIANILAILRSWGIYTLGELAALNKEELRDRLGSEAVRFWERANGTATRPLKFVQPPEIFQESFEFDHEIETAEPLLFILRRFLEQLSLRLSSIYLVARELTLTITFANRGSYERIFKIPQPTVDVDLLFRMLHTHLENFKSEHPIVVVALSAEPIRPVSQQFGLFETALRNPQQLYETLARLSALLGNDCVGRPVLEETHRPDAFRMEPFTWNVVAAAVSGGRVHESVSIALRRFRPPANAAIFISQDPPLPRLRRASRHLQSDKVRGQIIDQSGPFLLSGNWWDEKAWARAEHDMQLENGELLRAHQGEQKWAIDGIYD